MAAAISLLATLVIGHALMPAQIIVRVLKGLETGDHSSRLPTFRSREFNLIARAVNDLNDRLFKTSAERTALTRKLFQVQEEERRNLARDLHDEFGQCLTAASALSSAIEYGTKGDRPDIAQDAREISSVTDRMMGTLKSTLAKLRPPDLDELGLHQSLDHLIATWNARSAALSAGLNSPRSVRFLLDVRTSLSGVQNAAALNLYRIVQECLTNAAKHGRPTEVRVRVEDAPESRISLIVEDDGGGDPGRLVASTGRGVLGMRERIAAVGGSIVIDRAQFGRGIRITAAIPLTPLAADASLAEAA